MTFDWMPLYRQRVARLAKLVQLDAPVSIIAAETEMVYRAAFCAFAEEMGAAVAHAHLTHQAISSGMCAGCASEWTGHAPLCASCIALAIADGDDGGTR